MQWKSLIKDILLQSLVMFPLINLVIFSGQTVSLNSYFIIATNIIILLVVVGQTIRNHKHPILPSSFYYKKPLSNAITAEGFKERLVKSYAPEAVVIGLIVGLIPMLSSTFNPSWAGLLIALRFITRIVSGERAVKLNR